MKERGNREQYICEEMSVKNFLKTNERHQVTGQDAQKTNEM